MNEIREIKKNEIVINAYGSGTGHLLSEKIHLASRLYEKDTSPEARNSDQKTLTNKSRVKFGFDGCSRTHGIFLGGLFGAGVKSAAREVERFVRQCIREGKSVKLNIFGHSRGAIFALLAAWYLRDIPKEQLEIRLALHDPVPGNFRFWTWLDRLFFGVNLANQVMDLSSSKNLVKVDAVYPQEPLPFWEAHAPIMPSYPKDCEISEEVIGGCHSAAQYDYIIYDPVVVDDKISARRAVALMNEGGANLEGINEPKTSSLTLKNLYDYRKRNENVVETTRLCHSQRGVYISATKDAEFVNNQHVELSQEAHKEGQEDNNEKKSIQFRLKRGFLAPLFDFNRKYPWIGRALKWLALGAVTVGILYLTGGLAAIPFIAPLLVKFGAIAAVALVPAVSALASAVWHAVIVPIRDSIFQPALLAKAGKSVRVRIEKAGINDKGEIVTYPFWDSKSEGRDSLLDIFINWLRAGGIQYRQRFYRDTQKPSGLEGMQMLDDLNPFAQVIERADYPMARIYSSTLWTAIKDAFYVLMGNHYDLEKTGKGRKGILDVLIFPVIARRLLGYAANQERPPVVRAMMGALGILLEIPRAILGIVLTLPSTPLVLAVHLATRPEANRLKKKWMNETWKNVAVLEEENDKEDTQDDSPSNVSKFLQGSHQLNDIETIKMNENEDEPQPQDPSYGNLFNPQYESETCKKLNPTGERTYGLNVI